MRARYGPPLRDRSARPRFSAMFTFLSVIYVIICIFLILVVLLQSGKGGGMGAAFGGGGGTGQQVFGGAGAGNILTKMTAISAALFMILSATLAYLSSPGEDSLERAAEELNAGIVDRDDSVDAAEGDEETGEEENLDTAGAEGAREAFGELLGGDDAEEAVEDAEEALENTEEEVEEELEEV